MKIQDKSSDQLRKFVKKSPWQLLQLFAPIKASSSDEVDPRNVISKTKSKINFRNGEKDKESEWKRGGEGVYGAKVGGDEGEDGNNFPSLHSPGYDASF